MKLKITRNRVFLALLGGMAALGIAGGVALAASVSDAYAHGGLGKGGDGSSSFAARVADKLNGILGLEQEITQEQVQLAFNAANADRQVERLEARLDELEVAEESKTAILDWFNAYPYADLINFRTVGFASSENIDPILERMVEREKLTQAQADGIKSWYDDRPEIPEELTFSGKGKRGGKHGRHGRGHHSRMDRDGDDPGTFFRGRFHRGHRGDSDGTSL